MNKPEHTNHGEMFISFDMRGLWEACKLYMSWNYRSGTDHLGVNIQVLILSHGKSDKWTVPSMYGFKTLQNIGNLAKKMETNL